MNGGQLERTVGVLNRPKEPFYTINSACLITSITIPSVSWNVRIKPKLFAKRSVFVRGLLQAIHGVALTNKLG